MNNNFQQWSCLQQFHHLAQTLCHWWLCAVAPPLALSRPPGCCSKTAGRSWGWNVERSTLWADCSTSAAAQPASLMTGGLRWWACFTIQLWHWIFLFMVSCRGLTNQGLYALIYALCINLNSQLKRKKVLHWKWRIKMIYQMTESFLQKRGKNLQGQLLSDHLLIACMFR